MGRSKKSEDIEVLEAVALSPDPVVTASEVAERLDYTPDGVRNRLEELEKRGMVKSRKVGARAEVWWITDKGKDEFR